MPDFEGHYDVSNYGRIRSRKHGRVRLRKVSIHNRDGHRFVMLCKNGERHQLVVARLVLLAFVGPPPSEAHIACHDKGGNSNDYLWRLRWDTVVENNRDAVRHGTHRSLKGSQQPQAKLDDRAVGAILRRLAKGESQNTLAREFHVTQGLLSKLANGHIWQHVPRPPGMRIKPRNLSSFSDEELQTELARRATN